MTTEEVAGKIQDFLYSRGFKVRTERAAARGFLITVLDENGERIASISLDSQSRADLSIEDYMSLGQPAVADLFAPLSSDEQDRILRNIRPFWVRDAGGSCHYAASTLEDAQEFASSWMNQEDYGELSVADVRAVYPTSPRA